MNYLKYIVIYQFFYFVCLSCSATKKIDSRILTCFNDTIKDNLEVDSSIFFNSISNFEHFLIKNNYLRGTDKESYLLFFEEFKTNKNKFKNLYSLLEEEKIAINIDNFSLSNISHLYKNCLYKNLEQKKGSKYLISLLSSFEKMQISGFKDIDSLISIASNTDFEREEYRFLICSWFYMMISAM